MQSYVQICKAKQSYAKISKAIQSYAKQEVIAKLCKAGGTKEDRLGEPAGGDGGTRGPHYFYQPLTSKVRTP
jgi:hypothetical protein